MTVPPSKSPKMVCYYCGTRYGYKCASHLSDWHKGQCDVCGKLEALTDTKWFGELQPDWMKQYAFDVKKGFQPW